MFLKKMTVIIFIIFLCVSCGDFIDDIEDSKYRNYDDAARIKFRWDYEVGIFGLNLITDLVRFYDSNPSTPNNLLDLVEGYYRDGRFWGISSSRYYYTKPGQYYLEWELNSNHAYYMIYTIEIWKTSGQTFTGDDRMNTVDYKKNKYKSLDHFIEFEITLNHYGDFYAPYYSAPITYPEQGKLRNLTQAILDKYPGNRGPILERLEQRVNGGSMVIEYGRLY